MSRVNMEMVARNRQRKIAESNEAGGAGSAPVEVQEKAPPVKKVVQKKRSRSKARKRA